MQGLLTALAVAFGAVIATLTGTSVGSVAAPPTATPAARSVALTASPPVASAVTAASLSGGQLRAYFVDAFGPGIYDPSQIDAVVAAAKAANMNAIFAEV